jgi:hypothetical protein
MPTSGDRKQEKSDFLANGEMFFLDLLSHRRPRLKFAETLDAYAYEGLHSPSIKLGAEFRTCGIASIASLRQGSQDIFCLSPFLSLELGWRHLVARVGLGHHGSSSDAALEKGATYSGTLVRTDHSCQVMYVKEIESNQHNLDLRYIDAEFWGGPYVHKII